MSSLTMHEGLASTASPIRTQTVTPPATPAYRARRRGLLRVTAGLLCAATLIGAAWPAPLSASAVLAWTGMRSTVAEMGAHEAWTLMLFGIGMFVAGRSLRRQPSGE